VPKIAGLHIAVVIQTHRASDRPCNQTAILEILQEVLRFKTRLNFKLLL